MQVTHSHNMHTDAQNAYRARTADNESSQFMGAIAAVSDADSTRFAAGRECSIAKVAAVCLPEVVPGFHS
jgi:hypothetical protein